MSAQTEPGKMATGSDSTLSTPMQETGDPSEQLLRELTFAFAEISKRLQVFSRNPTARDRMDKRRLITFKEKVEIWIAIVRRKQENQLHPTGPSVLGRDDEDDESVPDDWKQQIYRPPLSAEMNSRIVAPPKLKTVAILQPDRYPNKLMIDRARVLVLTARYQFRQNENLPMERSAHDYTAVRQSLIEQFGYEDTLESIVVNTIILEKLQFENVTNERTGQVIRDNGFDREIPDIEHLNLFLETYRQLSSMLAKRKEFKRELNKRCQDNDLPDILRDVYWTWEEMQLMLNLLVDDPRNEKDANALIVFISMHGRLLKGKTFISDWKGNRIDVNKVLQKFEVPSIQNNDNLCSLVFLSVCRGDKDNKSEAVNVFVEDSGNEEVGVNADRRGSEDIMNKYVTNTERSDVIVGQGRRGATASEGLENTGRVGINVDQGGSEDTAREGLGKSGSVGINVHVDQGGSGDTTRDGLENTGRAGVEEDHGGSKDTLSEGLENTSRAGVNVHLGGSGDTTSEGLENTGSAGVNVDQGGKEDRTNVGLGNTACATPAQQPLGLQLQVEGSNDGLLSDSINDKQSENYFPGSSDDSNARIKAGSLPAPMIGPVHSSPSEREVVQENVVTENLLLETYGSCPNNCLVAYAATPGFKSHGYEYLGTLYIQRFAIDITQHESVALLPFLTLLHQRLTLFLEMPTFDHRLTKMPVLKKKRKRRQ